MKRQDFSIANDSRSIPAILWGDPQDRVLICVHDSMASKEDPTITLAAEIAEGKGFCCLSFDLPGHGPRSREPNYTFTPWNASNDLASVYNYAKNSFQEISIFACGIGAYLTMLIYPDISPKQLLFLSPTINVESSICSMMERCGVTEDQLEREGFFAYPDGRILDWEYYCYVKKHPINYTHKYFVFRPHPQEPTPMAILHGEQDAVVPWREAAGFSGWYEAYFMLLQNGDHDFHTKMQRKALAQWLDQYMSPIHVEPWLEKITSKTEGSFALDILLRESENWNSIYPYLSGCASLLDHPKSYVRNRALEIIAANAKWDDHNLFDTFIHPYLLHTQDETSTTARHCIQLLPKIAEAKPLLVPQIRAALQRIDLSNYSDRAQQSIQKVISSTLKAIENDG